MPKLLVAIPEVDTMVTRPVIKDITSQIIQHVGLPKDSLILYPDAEERVAIFGSTMEERNDKPADSTRFGQASQIKIDVTETIEERAVFTRAVHKAEHIPIFFDDEIGVMVKPVYVETDVEVSFNQRFKDKASAERWLAKMRNKLAMGADVYLHQVSYAYTLPAAILNILIEIWRKREAQGGYGQTFAEYLKDCGSPYITDVTNVGAKVFRKVVKEQQGRIQGIFDFQLEPERGGKEGEADNWEISFVYRFSYDKISAVHISYPISVHNQMLGSKFRPSREDGRPSYVPEQNALRRHHSGTAYRQFESDSDDLKNPQIAGLSVPDFDEFVPNQIIKGTYRMTSWLMGLTPDNLTECVSLKDLPKIELKENVHKFLLKSELPFMTREHKSIFQVRLYQDCEEIAGSVLDITEDGNIFANQTLDIRKRYHIRLGIYWDWRLLDQDALDRLRENPDVVEDLVCYLFPKWCGAPIDKIEDKLIPKGGMDDLIDTIFNWRDAPICMKTVQTQYIEVIRFKTEG